MMKMCVVLLSLYLLALTGCDHLWRVYYENVYYENAYQVLASTGFDGKHDLACSLRVGKVTKNISQDEINLLETLERSRIVGKIAPVPIYTIYFHTGGFWSYQTIRIYADQSGDGYVDYLGGPIAYFNCPDLPTFCEDAFKRSNMIEEPWHRPLRPPKH